jgi:hypothetical protein
MAQANDDAGDEIHWIVRSVPATGHRAMSTRLERLCVSAVLDPDVDKGPGIPVARWAGLDRGIGSLACDMALSKVSDRT